MKERKRIWRKGRRNRRIRWEIKQKKKTQGKERKRKMKLHVALQH